MADKHSQSPKVGIEHGNQGAESFLLQMLRQIRPSTSDLPIEVLGEMIMEAGEQELRCIGGHKDGDKDSTRP